MADGFICSEAFRGSLPTLRPIVANWRGKGVAQFEILPAKTAELGLRNCMNVAFNTAALLPAPNDRTSALRDIRGPSQPPQENAAFFSPPDFPLFLPKLHSASGYFERSI